MFVFKFYTTKCKILRCTLLFLNNFQTDRDTFRHIIEVHEVQNVIQTCKISLIFSEFKSYFNGYHIMCDYFNRQQWCVLRLFSIKFLFRRPFLSSCSYINSVRVLDLTYFLNRMDRRKQKNFLYIDERKRYLLFRQV